LTDPQTPPEGTPSQQPPQTPPQQTQQDPSAQYWQSKYDQTQHELQQIKQTVQQLQQTQQAPPTPPPQQTPQVTTTSDLNFMDINAWRAEDGGMKPEYAESVFGKDVPSDVRNQLWTTVNQAQQIVQQQTHQAVSNVFGSHDTYQQAAQKAAETLPPHERDALNAALGNPVLMPDALAKLKNMADENGWLQQQPQTNEPPQMNHNSQPSTTMTPLVPGSAEAKEAMAHPNYRKPGPEGDAYRQQLDQRLAMGMQQDKDKWSMM